MRKITIIFIFLFSLYLPSFSQTFKIVGLNTLYGAATGTGLGAATMMISGTTEAGALRVGFGAGTLAGLGLGIYDVSAAHGLIQGQFTTAEATGQIIAMDTFYGSSTGAIVGFAVSLIANEDLVEGLKVGAGYGAWAGFGFGLLESFVLGGSSDTAGGYGYMTSNSVNGFIQVQDSSYSIGFLSPSQINTIGTNGTIHTNTALTLTHIKIGF